MNSQWKNVPPRAGAPCQPPAAGAERDMVLPDGIPAAAPPPGCAIALPDGIADAAGTPAW